MGLEQTFAAGVETDYLVGQTFTKELQMQALTVSASNGSYAETSVVRPVWTCDAPSQLVAVYERHSVVGSTTGMVVKTLNSAPIASAAPVLSAAISHTAAVSITQSGTILNSTTLNTFAVGDSVGYLYSALGALAPVGVVTLVLQRI